MLRSFRGIGVCVAVCIGSTSAAEDWSYRVTPYLWLPSVDTSLDIGPNPPVEGSTSLLDVLDGAFLIAGEARRNDWAVVAELNYINLSNDFGIAPIDPIAEWRLRGTMASLAGAYRLPGSRDIGAEVLAGLRRWDVTASTTVLNFTASVAKEWVDPFVGLRFDAPVGERARLRGLANIGGFGVGSKRQWEVLAEAEWKASDLISVVGGYRHLEVEFTDGALIEFGLSGPFVSVAFTF